MKSIPTTHSIDLLVQDALRLMQSDVHRAFEVGKVIQEQSTSLNPPYPKGEGCGLFIQGIVHLYRTEYETAHTALSHAVQLFKSIEDKEWYARALNPLGAVYRHLGDFSTALTIYHDELAVSRGHNDKMSEMRALNGIATIYHQLKDFSQALYHLNPAQELAQHLRDSAAEAVILGNICDAYLNLTRYDEALDAGLKSLALFEQAAPNMPEYVNGLLNVGITYQRMGNFTLAQTYLEKARQLSEQRQLNYYYLLAMQELGKLYIRLEQPETARVYLHQTLARAKVTGAEKSIYTCFAVLAELYKKIGKFEMALYYMEQYYTLKETIFNDESDRRIKTLEFQYHAETARKEAELYRGRVQEQERLREQDRQMYERLTNLKSEFIRSATHDLKNPISAIKLLMHLIEKHGQVTDDRGKQLWERLLQQMEVIQTLVSDMLDYARLETGYALNLAAAQLHPALTEVMQDAQAIADKRGIMLIVQNQLAEDIAILYDSTRLSQAFRGLLRYVLQRMPEGGTLHIEMIGQRDSKITLRLLVGGWYIDSSDLEDLFKPFFRARSFDDKPSQGSGLGLALVRAIIEQHGGQITVNSHRETGSRFQVVLPAEAMQPAG